MTPEIPVTAVIASRNAGAGLAACLDGLAGFGEIVVIESGNPDSARAPASTYGARVVPFQWTGRYPKKRQWILENVALKHDWLLFIDADERMTPALAAEIRDTVAKADRPGFFVDGVYEIRGRVLNRGFRNRKLVLLRKGAFAFPHVDDLDFPGMGEMEGHYQPVSASGRKLRLGRLRNPMIHVVEDRSEWYARHRRYAQWTACMNAARAWPEDPSRVREMAKRLWRSWPLKPFAVFWGNYLLRGGFLDGRAGLEWARDRAWYAREIRRAAAGTGKETKRAAMPPASGAP